MADTPYTENSMSRKELKNAQKSVKKAKKAEDKKKVIQMNHHRGNITRILVIISLILLVAQNVFTIFGVVNMAIGFCIAVSLFLAFVILMCEFHKWPGLTMYFLFCDVRFGQAITFAFLQFLEMGVDFDSIRFWIGAAGIVLAIAIFVLGTLFNH
ncbi:hypothetical protein ADUPG1_000059 [Aduncisulcus paluster]|uniref:Uncharacterized protein n=1 Tax=Aduncisulcus paluster TaxID=2918883 RepID=A0ABQ5K4I1_9EUKA|nr:hypothetical protein ADUPG1_000059 [Aduncisulcus paluster]